MSVSRVCIRADRDGDPVAVDVVLPSEVAIAELLPAIVAMIDARTAPGDTARRWRLQHACGGVLGDSWSLSDNGVRDGELLILDADDAPTLGPVRRAVYQEVSASRPSAGRLGGRLADGLCVLSAVAAAAVLAAGAGTDDATLRAIIAAAAAAAAAVMAVVSGYPTACCVAVVSLACATGFLVVPSAPAAPHVFLAATAASSAALLVLRLSGRSSPGLIAVATLSLLTALVTAVAVPLAVVGAALGTASLILLALAPRASVLAAGLGPNRGHGGVTDAAGVAHAALSGLVAGCAAGGAAGAVVTVVAAVVAVARPTGAGAIAFSALVASVLLLRSRTYVDEDRRIALRAGGLVAAAACLYLVSSLWRESTEPIACLLVVGGLIAVRRPTCGAAVARTLDRVEYVALAAVVPAACWAAGAYGVAGGVGLR